MLMPQIMLPCAKLFYRVHIAFYIETGTLQFNLQSACFRYFLCFNFRAVLKYKPHILFGINRDVVKQTIAWCSKFLMHCLGYQLSIFRLPIKASPFQN